MKPIYNEDFDKAVEIIQMCIDKFFKREGFNIKATNHMGTIYITEYEDKFSNGKSMMMCNVFERIFVLTGFYPCAVQQDVHEGKNYIQLTMHHKDDFKSVNRKGEYWDEQECNATCPKCGETESFDLMKYSPTDHRDMNCPKCDYRGSVSTYYSEDEKQ